MALPDWIERITEQPRRSIAVLDRHRDPSPDAHPNRNANKHPETFPDAATELSSDPLRRHGLPVANDDTRDPAAGLRNADRGASVHQGRAGGGDDDRAADGNGDSVRGHRYAGGVRR